MAKFVINWSKGVVGTVKYDEIEDSFVLDIGGLDVGLFSMWEDFEDYKVKVTVELIE